MLEKRLLFLVVDAGLMFAGYYPQLPEIAGVSR
jgi:hypothetical protein